MNEGSIGISHGVHFMPIEMRTNPGQIESENSRFYFSQLRGIWGENDDTVAPGRFSGVEGAVGGY